MTFPDENLCAHGMAVCEVCAEGQENAACAALVRAAAAEQRAEAARLLSDGNWLPVDRMQHIFAAEVLERLAAAIEARRG